jgi:hypothetical protein
VFGVSLDGPQPVIVLEYCSGGIKSNQIKSNQIKSNQIANKSQTHIIVLHLIVKKTLKHSNLID